MATVEFVCSDVIYSRVVSLPIKRACVRACGLCVSGLAGCEYHTHTFHFQRVTTLYGPVPGPCS